MQKELICIVCPQGCRLNVEEMDGTYHVSGNTCKRGETYGITEMTAPTRVITTTVAFAGGRYVRLPVKTKGAVPKGMIFDCMEKINEITITAPIRVGDVLIQDILHTGIDVVATRTMK